MTTETRETLAIGSWSSGSTRTEDWAAAALDMVAGLPDRAREDLAGHWADLATWLDTGHIDYTDEDDHECGCDETAAFALEELIAALHDYAPIYCYVGAAPGDGADFGVWVDSGALDEAIRTGVTLVPTDRNGAGSILNVEDGVIIDVTDHGNVTVSTIERGRVLLAAV